MFKIIFATVIITIYFQNSFAFAGWKEVGNGGGACVCRDINFQITEAKSSDLALLEAFNKKIITTNETIPEKILQNIFSKDLEPLKYMLELGKPKKIEFIPEKAKLSYIQDFVMHACKSKNANGDLCAYEQLANFTIENTLYVSSEIYNSKVFTNVDRAALLAHEYIYSLDRLLNKAENSDFTKQFLRLLFDENKNILEIYQFAYNRFYALDFAIIFDDVELIKKLNEAHVDLSLETLEKNKSFDKILFYKSIKILNYLLEINKDKKFSFAYSSSKLPFFFYILSNDKSNTSIFKKLLTMINKDSINYMYYLNSILHVLVDFGNIDLIDSLYSDLKYNNQVDSGFIRDLYYFFERYKDLEIFEKLYSEKIQSMRNFNYLSIRDIKYPYTNLHFLSIAILKHNNELVKYLTDNKRINLIDTTFEKLGDPCMIALMESYNSYIKYLGCK